MIQHMLAIWSLVTLRFLNPVCTSWSSWFTYSWSLAWRILSKILLACEMSAVYITLILLISFHRTCNKAEFFYLYMSGSALEGCMCVLFSELHNQLPICYRIIVLKVWSPNNQHYPIRISVRMKNVQIRLYKLEILGWGLKTWVLTSPLWVWYIVRFKNHSQRSL